MMPDFDTWYPSSPHGEGTLNVLAFGAKGDGLANDTVAIQNCFDAAFGPKEAPHGEANKHLNKAVYFPPGNYQFDKTLYLTDIHGGKIYSDGTNGCTLGTPAAGLSNVGTVWRTSEPSPKLTPMICMNGCSYFTVENMGFGMGGTAGLYPAGSCVFDICNMSPTGVSTNCQFRCVAVTGGDWCMRVGYLDSGVGNDSFLLYNVNLLSGNISGLSMKSASAVNWMVIGGGAAGCSVEFAAIGGGSDTTLYASSTSTFIPGGDPGNWGAGYSVEAGQICYIGAMSNSQNGIDVINGGGEAMTLQSGSSECPNGYFATNNSTISAGAVICRLNNPISRLIDAQLGGIIHAMSSVQAPPRADVGYFANVGNSGQIIMDNCVKSFGGLGLNLGFEGSPGGAIWVKRVFEEPGSKNFQTYTGQVMEYAPPIADAPLSLTPGAMKFRGLRRVITDATATTPGTAVVGGGSNRVYAYCTGAEWLIMGPA